MKRIFKHFSVCAPNIHFFSFLPQYLEPFLRQTQKTNEKGPGDWFWIQQQAAHPTASTFSLRWGFVGQEPLAPAASFVNPAHKEPSLDHCRLSVTGSSNATEDKAKQILAEHALGCS